MLRIPKSIVRTVLPLGVVVGVFALVAAAARTRLENRSPVITDLRVSDVSDVVAKVDRILEKNWSESRILPAKPASELELLRRLSLVLTGTIPSLEELRTFERESGTNRIEHWVERLLSDTRFSDYYARRFARVFVGANEGPFLQFRRDRFWTWLGEQIQKNRPYDAMVRDMIAERGLWTGVPEVNYVTAAVADGNLDVNKLAGRTARAFLGQRIDCAQCHNHPTAEWKQAQFEGLAACFGQVSFSPVGVEDNRKGAYTVQDRTTLEDREVKPEVPFHSEWMPDDGTYRQRLARWVTHPENRRFERAIVNRVWGLMFGKPWIEPVDDLPNPVESGRDPNDVLDVLGGDFREHGCDLKRLISAIAATRVFRLSSEHAEFDLPERADVIEKTWAAFPVTRLRPEQIIGAMLQASSLKTIDRNSHWVMRALRFFQELNFVKEYGDLGEDELAEHSGTIPQALLRMNGEFVKDRSQGTPFSAPGRISSMAPTDEECLDLCFLVCLTRLPTVEERTRLLPQLVGIKGDARGHAVEDVFWSLYNSAEFCWEH